MCPLNRSAAREQIQRESYFGGRFPRSQKKEEKQAPRNANTVAMSVHRTAPARAVENDAFEAMRIGAATEVY